MFEDAFWVTGVARFPLVKMVIKAATRTGLMKWTAPVCFRTVCRPHLAHIHRLRTTPWEGPSLYGGPDHVDGVASQRPCLAVVGGKGECEEEDKEMEEEEEDKIATNGQICKCDK